MFSPGRPLFCIVDADVRWIDTAATSIRCTELNLARAFADGAKMAAILSALSTEASRVTALNLRSNSFRNAGTVKALASLLAADTKLVDLQMPHTALGDGGTLAIAEALANNVDSRVATLNLFNNGITCRGAEGELCCSELWILGGRSL